MVGDHYLVFKKIVKADRVMEGWLMCWVLPKLPSRFSQHPFCLFPEIFLGIGSLPPYQISTEFKWFHLTDSRKLLMKQIYEEDVFDGEPSEPNLIQPTDFQCAVALSSRCPRWNSSSTLLDLPFLPYLLS